MNAQELVQKISKALESDGVLASEWAVNFRNHGTYVVAEIQVELLIPTEAAEEFPDDPARL